MAFDYEGARGAGWSDQAIADYLAGQGSFDLEGARSAGHSDATIVQHLLSKQAPPEPAAPDFWGGVGDFWKGAGTGFISSPLVSAQGIAELPYAAVGDIVGSPEDNAVIEWTRRQRRNVQDFFGGDPTSHAYGVGQAVGSLGSYLMPAIGQYKLAAKGLETLGKFVGRGGVGTLAVGSGVGVSSERLFRMSEQLGKEVPEGDRRLALALGIPIGLTELIPIRIPAGIILGKIPKGTDPRIIKRVLNSLSRSVLVGGQEGTQEALAGVLQDLVEKNIYNPDLEVGESAAADFGYGASAGVIFQTALEMMLPRRRGDGLGEPPPATAPEPTTAAAPPVPEEGPQLLLEAPTTTTLALEDLRPGSERTVRQDEDASVVAREAIDGLAADLPLSFNRGVISLDETGTPDVYVTEEAVVVDGQKTTRPIRGPGGFYVQSRNGVRASPYFATPEQAEVYADELNIGINEIFRKQDEVETEKLAREAVAAAKMDETDLTLVAAAKATMPETLVDFSLLGGSQQIQLNTNRSALNRRQYVPGDMVPIGSLSEAGIGAETINALLEESYPDLPSATVGEVLTVAAYKNINVEDQGFERFSARRSGAGVTATPITRERTVFDPSGQQQTETTTSSTLDTLSPTQLGLLKEGLLEEPVLPGAGRQSLPFVHAPEYNPQEMAAVLTAAANQEARPDKKLVRGEIQHSDVNKVLGHRGRPAQEILDKAVKRGELIPRRRRSAKTGKLLKAVTYIHPSALEGTTKAAREAEVDELGGWSELTADRKSLPFVPGIIIRRSETDGAGRSIAEASDTFKRKLQKSQATAEAKRKHGTESENRKLRRIINKALVKQLNRIRKANPAFSADKVIVGLASTIGGIDPITKGFREGRAETDKVNDRIIITLALDAIEPGSNPKDAAVQLADVMNHEVVHALKALGLISEADMAVLMRFVKRKQTSGPMKGVSYYDEVMASGYADHYNDAWMEENNIPPESRDQAREELVVEEAIANAFSDYASGARRISGKPQSLFRRIIDFFINLKEGLTNANILSTNEIFGGWQGGPGSPTFTPRVTTPEMEKEAQEFEKKYGQALADAPKFSLRRMEPVKTPYGDEVGVIRNPSRGEIARILAERYRQGQHGSVRFILSPDKEEVIAFDGFVATHDDVIEGLGWENDKTGRAETYEVISPKELEGDRVWSYPTYEDLAESRLIAALKDAEKFSLRRVDPKDPVFRAKSPLNDKIKIAGQAPPPRARRLSIVDILYNPEIEDRAGLRVGDVSRLLKARTNRVLKKPVDIVNDTSKDDLISSALAMEALQALKTKDTAATWYTDEVEEAISIVSEEQLMSQRGRGIWGKPPMHPEIATDPDAKFAFLVSLAVTSQTVPVLDNARYAEEVYSIFRETGLFPENYGKGKSASAMKENFRDLNTLIKRMDNMGGISAVRKFFGTPYTVKQLKEEGFDVSSAELVDADVYGSYILGAKIGNGFYQNLNGNYDPVTIDMWLMRTMGRMTGFLIGKPELVGQQSTRLLKGLRERGDNELTSNLVGYIDSQDTDAIFEMAAQLTREHDRIYKTAQKNLPKGEKYKKPEWAHAAEAIVTQQLKPEDNPSSGGYRKAVRRIFQKTLAKMRDSGYNVTPADLQAILWYPEKDLYKKLGAKGGRELNISYAEAFRRLRDARDETIRAVERGGDRGVGAVEDGTREGSRRDSAITGTRLSLRRPSREELIREKQELDLYLAGFKGELSPRALAPVHQPRERLIWEGRAHPVIVPRGYTEKTSKGVDTGFGKAFTDQRYRTDTVKNSPYNSTEELLDAAMTSFWEHRNNPEAAGFKITEQDYADVRRMRIERGEPMMALGYAPQTDIRIPVLRVQWKSDEFGFPATFFFVPVSLEIIAPNEVVANPQLAGSKGMLLWSAYVAPTDGVSMRPAVFPFLNPTRGEKTGVGRAMVDRGIQDAAEHKTFPKRLTMNTRHSLRRQYNNLNQEQRDLIDRNIQVGADENMWDKIMGMFKASDPSVHSWRTKFRRVFVDNYASGYARERQLIKRKRELGEDGRIALDSATTTAAVMLERAKMIMAKAITEGPLIRHNGWIGPMTEDNYNFNERQLSQEVNDRIRGDYRAAFDRLARETSYEEVDPLDPTGETKTTIRYESPADLKGFVQIMSPAEGDGTVPLFLLYTAAFRANRLMVENREKTFTQADIDAGLALAERYPYFKQMHREYQLWNNSIILMMEDSGLITKDAGELWRDNGDYLPFYRELYGVPGEEATSVIYDVMSPESSPVDQTLFEAMNNPNNNIFQNFYRAPTPKTLKGGKPTYWLMVNNVADTIRFSEREGTEIRAREAQLRNLNPEALIRRAADNQRIADPINNILKNVDAAVTASLMNVYASRAVRDLGELGLATRIGEDIAEPGPNRIGLRVGGETRWYDVKDDLLFQSLQASGGLDGIMLDIQAAPAQLLRELVTKDPAFMGANMLRDTLTSWVTSGVKVRPVVGTLRGFGEALLGTSSAKAFEASGAVGGYEFKGAPKSALSAYRKHARLQHPTKSMRNATSMFWDQTWGRLDRMTASSDTAARLAVVNRVLKDTGGDMTSAIVEGIEVINFGRKGANPLVRYLTATIPFLNARIQGLDVLARGGAGTVTGRTIQAKRRLSFYLRALTIVGVTAAYHMSKGDEEENPWWYNAKEHEKDNYWILSPRLFGVDTGPESPAIRWPIPFEVGVLFKVIPERIMQLIDGQTDFREATRSALRHTTSTFNFLPVPQWMLPALETTINYDFFRGRPVVTYWQNKNEAWLADPEYTSPLAIEISRALDEQVGYRWSAEKIDHLLRGYTGTLGSYALMAADSIMRNATGMPVRSQRRLDQQPVLGRFLQQQEGRGPIETFTELSKELDIFVQSSNAMLKAGDYKRMDEYRMSRRGLEIYRENIENVKKDLQQLRTFRAEIQRSRGVSPERKREKLTEIDRLMNEAVSYLNTRKGEILERRH